MRTLALTQEHRDFLKSRGYTDELIDAEPVKTIPSRDESIVAWECWTAGGTKLGEQWRWTDRKLYRWFGEEAVRHLPVCYATEEDHRLLHEERKVILTEGPFDRIAVKRAFPDWAVFARLTAAVGQELIRHLTRLADDVVLCFDMNEAGIKGAEKAQKRLGRIAETRLSYPANDPGDLLLKYGEERVREFLAPQLESLSWL